MLAPDDVPTLEPLADGTGYRVRVRFGEQRRRITIPSTDLDFATRRAVVLIAMGADLSEAPAELAHDWLKRAGAADAAELGRIQAAVAKLASGVKVRPVAQNPRSQWTIQDLGDAWTGGTLAKEFPDQIKARKAVGNDISRLKRHVYALIGTIRVSALTLADVERVMASLHWHGRRKPGSRLAPRKLSALARRTIALTLNRLLGIAVFRLDKNKTDDPRAWALSPGVAAALAHFEGDPSELVFEPPADPMGMAEVCARGSWRPAWSGPSYTRRRPNGWRCGCTTSAAASLPSR